MDKQQKQHQVEPEHIRYVPIASDALFKSESAVQEVSLKELLGALFNGKWIIVCITGFFSILSVLIALSLPNIYKAQVLLAPAMNEQPSGLGALTGQFGGLASLAGIELGGSDTGKTVMALQVLQSRQFIGDFVTKHDVLTSLMAVEGWDLQTNQLIYDESKYAVDEAKWVRDVKPPRYSKPSLQEAFVAFEKIFSVDQNKDNGMVTISIEHYSPYLAKKWVDLIVDDINQNMKERDVKEAQRSIEYLQREIVKANIAELKSVLYQLVEEQTKTLMLANVREEYTFKTLDPAQVPELKEKPNRALISILGFVLGGMLGVFIVLIRYLNKGSKARSKLSETSSILAK